MNEQACMDDEIRASAGIQRNMHGVHGCGYIPLCVHIEYMYTHVHTAVALLVLNLVPRASVRRGDQKLKKHPTAKLPGYPDTGVIIEPQQMRRMDALLKKIRYQLRGSISQKYRTAQNGSKRLFLCEKRLSNAQESGLCEANAGYAPRRVVC